MSASRAFTRLSSTGAAPSAQASRAMLDSYFTYFKTPVAMRPLVYRPRNANTLLAMDMKDPETKQQIKPLQPVASVPKSAFMQFLRSTGKGSDEFFRWIQPWVSVTPRKRQIFQYFTPQMFQWMLIQSFFVVGDYTRMVGYLYTNRSRFEAAKNPNVYDVDHFMATVLMCSIQRGSVFQFTKSLKANIKLKSLWKNTLQRTQKTGLAPLLLDCYCHQQGITVESTGITFNEVSVALPSTSGLKDAAEKEKFANTYEATYLLTRTIQEFAPNGEVNKEVARFVDEYKALKVELGVTSDIYDQFKITMTELWTVKNTERKKRKAAEAVRDAKEAAIENEEAAAAAAKKL